MDMKNSILLWCTIAAVAVASAASGVEAADWPMWRYDSGRTASSPENLPDELNLLWVRQYSPRTTVWEDPLNQDIMPYDKVFEPVVMGNTMFIGFNDADKVVALDTSTGRERWTFRAEGPVRLAPAAWNGKVYFVSDDGYLYCVRANNGKLIWKIRGGPSDRKVLGNSRLISMWPARGGVVVHEGVVYFAASIWPFMGTFIRAVDAETGNTIWLNDGNGAEFMLQPHNAPSFAGVAPQGSFVISDGKLLIPGGRSVPAVFDLATGKFLYYQLASSGKTGGSFVCARDGVFFNHFREKVTTLYDLKTGATLVSTLGIQPVMGRDTWFFSGPSITAYRSDWVARSLAEWAADTEIEPAEIPKRARARTTENRLWEINIDASGDLIQAGGRLYAGGDGVITAVDASSQRVAWVKQVDGKIERLVAADGKLIAVTLDGRVMAFGPKKTEPRLVLDRPLAAEYPAAVTNRARSILERSGIREGYALMYGTIDGDLLAALIANSRLHIVAVDPDGRNVLRLKERFDRNGLYGSRVAIHHGDPSSFPAPPYIASLIIADDSVLAGGALTGIYSSLRPYGGTAWLTAGAADGKRIASLAGAAGFEGATFEAGNGFTLLKREGPLPGASDWTHNYGDVANTAKSDDNLVRLPLGLLWFGGNSNLDVLPRHGHGPSEQVVGGLLYIQGMDCLSARDVYTGRVVWKKTLLDLGTYNVYYDGTYRDAPTNTRYNQVHIPGANIRGTNYIATLDRVYVLQGTDCLVLDAKTGETMDTFRLPPVDPEAERPVRPEWAYLGVSGDYLIGGAGFVTFSDLVSTTKQEYTSLKDFDTAGSKGLVVMNRFTGETLWNIDASHGFLHNGIAAGDGLLFCLDKLPPHIEQQFSRRGKSLESANRLCALDIATGRVVWENREIAFGSFLAYSGERGLLVQSTRPSRDMVGGETGRRMTAFRGSDGAVVWDKPLEYATFPIIHGDRLITEGRIFGLLDGSVLTRKDPLTGNDVQWTWKRNYGCNYPVASEHLLTFRSGAAGYFDLETMSGTGNFGGFKSGCTINLIAADGVLNAPDYTRTCSCSYQNQTSLAMIHMPDADIEMWTFDTVQWDGSQVERVGLNFGAPGDSVDDGGTLWLDYPSVGGESPDIPVETVPANPDFFRFHSSRITDGVKKWVEASGAVGVTELKVTLSKEPAAERSYTVRMHFTEPEATKPGERVFDVTLQGRKQASGIDIVRETGAPERAVVREFKGVRAGDSMTVGLIPAAGSSKPPVVSGIEIVAER